MAWRPRSTTPRLRRSRATRWDGSTAALTGGVCGRTAQIRDKLVELVKVNDTDCHELLAGDGRRISGR